LANLGWSRLKAELQTGHTNIETMTDHRPPEGRLTLFADPIARER